MDANKQASDQQSKAVEHTAAEQVVRGDSAEGIEDDREQRILDCLECSLRQPGALQATIGAVNSDLMLIGYRLNQAVQTAMNTTPAALNEYSKLMPAVESLLKVYRQVDRFSQLEVRLTKAAQTPANIPEPELAGPTRSEEMAG